MDQEQQLDEFKEQHVLTASARHATPYGAEIEQLRTSFALEAAVGRETKAPEFRLPDGKDDLVSRTNCCATAQL